MSMQMGLVANVVYVDGWVRNVAYVDPGEHVRRCILVRSYTAKYEQLTS